MEKYAYEKDGQSDFFRRFLPRVDPFLAPEDIVSDHNDGVLHGNLLEFKLHVTDLNAALFQCIKYLSALRVKGKPVPGGILVVDLNGETAWYFRAENYLAQIEKLYFGGASKDNGGFLGGEPEKTLRYGDSPSDAEELTGLLKTRDFVKVHIDENCVVGWATSFYKTVPGSRKEDFIGDETGKHQTLGEIRRPQVFREYLLPYTGPTNVRFQYLMDRLNDDLQKKDLGAFYTNRVYADKSLELVRKAISRVPKGNDYIILDRCAGTGNLESGMTEEELSHCIVSTVEYYEYKVLLELFGARVRHMIPPVESAHTFYMGLVPEADALSKGYLENPLIKRYLDDPKCTIILFENPPYGETTSVEHQKRGAGRKSSGWKESYVVTEMKKEVRGTASNDMGNAFIWSGFRYYLRQPTDSYIVYSPVKYWKAQHLINKKFLGGFAFNRRHFHTNIDACIMCALWSNEDEPETTRIDLDAYDLIDGTCVYQKKLPVKRVYTTFSQKYYDKRVFPEDLREGILVGYDGLEKRAGVKVSNRPVQNPNLVGYLVADSSSFDNPDLMSCLLVEGLYKGHGCYIREDTYLQKLPMFAASRYITYNREWTERGRVMKSGDGAAKFQRDVKNGKLRPFLLKCLLFACVEMQNHMRSFYGTDGRFYRNRLCLDGTHGETLALRDLKDLRANQLEKTILRQWGRVLGEAKKTSQYDPEKTYGVYQIFAEMDTSHKDEITGETVWDYVELHTALQGLKTLVKHYYNEELVPVLFEYEFLK